MFKRAWLKVKYSIWLKPAWLTVASLLLAVLTGLIDSGRWFALADIMPDFMLTGVELAKTILGVTSGAMLSMTVFTFSTTMVVLTTYSSQYSPRVVRNFLTDDETVQTLGIFMGGFVYSIMALSFMKTSLNGRPVISANLSILLVIWRLQCRKAQSQIFTEVNQVEPAVCLSSTRRARSRALRPRLWLGVNMTASSKLYVLARTIQVFMMVISCSHAISHSLTGI